MLPTAAQCSVDVDEVQCNFSFSNRQLLLLTSLLLLQVKHSVEVSASNLPAVKGNASTLRCLFGTLTKRLDAVIR